MDTRVVEELVPVAASIVLRRYGMASDVDDRIAAANLALVEAAQRYNGTERQQLKDPAHQARYLLSFVAGDMRHVASHSSVDQETNVPFVDYNMTNLEQIPYTPQERDVLNHHTFRVRDGRLMTGMEIINAIMATPEGTKAVAKHLGLHDKETGKTAESDQVRFGLTMVMMDLAHEMEGQPETAPVTKKYTNTISTGHTLTIEHLKNGVVNKTTVLGRQSAVVNGEMIITNAGDEAILAAMSADNWDADQEEADQYDEFDVIDTPCDAMRRDLYNWPEQYMGNGAWRELCEIWFKEDAIETILFLAAQDEDSPASAVLRKLADYAAGYNPDGTPSGWTDHTCQVVAGALSTRMMDRGVQILTHEPGRDPVREIKEQLCAFMGVDVTEAYDYETPEEGTLLRDAEQWFSGICEVTSNKTRNVLKALVLFGASPHEATHARKVNAGWWPED